MYSICYLALIQGPTSKVVYLGTMIVGNLVSMVDLIFVLVSQEVNFAPRWILTCPLRRIFEKKRDFLEILPLVRALISRLLQPQCRELVSQWTRIRPWSFEDHYTTVWPFDHLSWLQVMLVSHNKRVKHTLSISN